MNNSYNLKLYGLYAPRYERLFGWLYTRTQRRAVELLSVQPGERVLVPGVGTGMGLAELPVDAHITAVDLSPAMLAQAQRKLAGRSVSFEVMDAQHLRFADGCFDAVLLSLILSVVPDGAAALVSQIDYDWTRFRLQGHDQVATIMRLREFDRRAQDLLSRHPSAIVVHIGCGLDTRFERVDNGQVTWYDLDLPEVIALRRQPGQREERMQVASGGYSR